jgi:hypothetical protein
MPSGLRSTKWLSGGSARAPGAAYFTSWTPKIDSSLHDVSVPSHGW